MRVCRLFVVVALVMGIWGIGSAGAAPPKATFFGMQVDGALLDGRLDLKQQLGKIKATGVGTVRFDINWDQAQPYATWADVPTADAARFVDVGGVPTDFSVADGLVGAVADAGLRALPVVIRAPVWARDDAGQDYSPPSPSGRVAYAHFAAALAKRYGTRGTFWDAHAYLPRLVIKQWQVWNEPNGPFFWTEQPGMADYTRLLEKAYPAIKAADPHAKVVAAGLFGNGWTALGDIYRAGGGKFFDIAAIHPFTLKVYNVLRIIRKTRRVMRRHGDKDKPLIASELSWPAAIGHTPKETGFETTVHGQARRIALAFRLLAQHRHEYHLQAAYWSTWVTSYVSPSFVFDYSGLFRITDAGALITQPSYGAFRSTLRTLRHPRS